MEKSERQEAFGALAGCGCGTLVIVGVIGASLGVLYLVVRVVSLAWSGQ